MYKLVFFVPATHKEAVKESLFAIGAGRIGAYEACSWECEGTGQFRPLAGANPAIGQIGALETVREYRVELVFRDELLNEVAATLRRTHPYEEPAFDIVRLVDV